MRYRELSALQGQLDRSLQKQLQLQEQAHCNRDQDSFEVEAMAELDEDIDRLKNEEVRLKRELSSHTTSLQSLRDPVQVINTHSYIHTFIMTYLLYYILCIDVYTS